MNHLPQVINNYLDFGDSEVMEKIRDFLSDNFDFHNLTSEYIQSFPILDIANKMGTFFFTDIQEIQNPSSKEKQVKIIINITRYVFNEFFKEIKNNESNKAALVFVTVCENALDEAHTIHDSLSDLITAIPFEDYKDKCLDRITPNINGNKVYFEWLIPKMLLEELSRIIHLDYNIIRAPTRFEKLLIGNSNIRITTNRLKEGHFVFLIRSLLGKEFEGKYKYLKVRGGKGFWMLLEQITFDFDGKKLANHDNYFKNLSLKMSKKNEDSKFIIKEIEEILEIIAKKVK